MGIKARAADKTTTKQTPGAGKSRAATPRKPAPARRAAARPAQGSSAPASSAAGKTVDGYIATLDDWRADALRALRQLIRDVVPDVEEAIKWAQPVYSYKGPFCYVRARARHINLGFWRGRLLDVPGAALESGGDRMAHLKIRGLDDIREDVIRALLEQAVRLNELHGDPTRR